MSIVLLTFVLAALLTIAMPGPTSFLAFSNGARHGLRDAGFAAEEAAAYEAVSADRLPDAAREALERKQLSLVLFHSSRAAAAFTSLVDDADLTDRLGYLIAVAISGQAADSLIRSDWLAVKIADTPDEAALLDRVGAARLDP